MKTYTVKIDGKEVTTVENGEYSETRYAIQFKESKTIETDQLTKKDIIKALKEILYFSNNYDENDLFNGNEDYFIFNVLENGDGYEASEREIKSGETLYGAEYFIDIEVVEKIKTIDIK